MRAAWWRDLVVGLLGACSTALVLVPLAWTSQRYEREQLQAARHEAQEAALLAEQKASEAAKQRAQAQRNLLDQAMDFAGVRDKAEVEIIRVTTGAVAPEVPPEAHLLIDKKTSSYAAGDIVVFRQGGDNYLGRVVTLDKAGRRVTVARNGEPNREIAVTDLVGRGILNTR